MCTVRMSVSRAMQRAITSCEGRQPLGKIIVRMKRARHALDPVRAVVHRDRLQQHRAVGLQQVRAAREERVEVLPADGLDHLDRDELVVAAAQVAVVLEQHGHAILEPGLAHAPHGGRVLVRGDRRRGHAAAARAGGVHGERAPARADLQQVVGRLQVELVEDQLELGASRPARASCPGRVEQRAGVHHRRVEHPLEQVVAEVVVGLDVLARCAAACCARTPGGRAGTARARARGGGARRRAG